MIILRTLWDFFITAVGVLVFALTYFICRKLLWPEWVAFLSAFFWSCVHIWLCVRPDLSRAYRPIGWTHNSNLLDDGYTHNFSVISSEPGYGDFTQVFIKETT